MKKRDSFNSGLPTLDLSERPYSFFEFWPAWFFYIPVVFYWLYLSVKYRSVSMPLQVNPAIFLSGMVGESKAEILDLLSQNSAAPVLPYCVLNYNCASIMQQVSATHEAMQKSCLEYPVVIKPDVGCRGNGVRKIQSREELSLYLSDFPQGRKYIVQRLSPYEAEAGIFFTREPGSALGKITSITLKYTPYVVGDGKQRIEELIDADPRAFKLRKLYRGKLRNRLFETPPEGEIVPLVFAGSHSRGAIFRNGNKYITAKMTRSIQEAVSGIPDFHYGRLDLKFSDLAALQDGRDFCLIEVNGASSEETHIWDANTRFRDVFGTLFSQYRTLFAFGAMLQSNRHLFDQYKHTRYTVLQLLVHWLRELKSGRHYPDSF